MAKYRITPSSKAIIQLPISIGHKAEKGVEAIEFDLTAWVETYGSGTLTVIMRRWGDAIPYPIALEIDENNKATWTLSDIDTAKAGMAYAQLSYVVGETVVKKSDIYTFRVMDSLTGEGDPPEAYDSWLEHLTHLAAEAMAEVLDIEGIVTDKTLTIDGGIADGKATGDALALKADKSTTYTKTEVDALIDEVEVETDTTLTISGAPADAAETGRQIGLLKADLGDLSNLETHTTSDLVSAINEAAQSGLSNAAKETLLACFRNVVWRDTSLGKNLYDSLVSALETYDVVAFGDLTQFEIGQRGFTRENGAYINSNLPAWCACDISSLNFNVGDKIKLIGALKNTYTFNVGTRDANATVTAKTFIKNAVTSDDLVLEASNITDAKAIVVRRQDSVNLTNQDIDAISSGLVWKKSGEDIYHTYKFEYPSTLLKASGQIDLLNSPYGLQHKSNAGRRTIYMGYGKIPYASEASGNPLVAEYPIPIPDDAVGVKVSITPNTQYIYLGLLVWDSANNKYTRTRGFAWSQGVSNQNLSSYMSSNRALLINTKYNEAGTTYPAEPTKVVVEFTKEGE